MTIPNADTLIIEALHAFAAVGGEIQFAHLCTAALAGEEWAVERLAAACATYAKRGSAHWHANVLAAIRATDTTRPDGAIARSVEV